MKISNGVNKKISFSIAITIIIICAILAGSLAVWQYLGVSKIEIPEFKPAEKTQLEDETADWKTYRNEEYGFEIKYPPEDWRDWRFEENHYGTIQLTEEEYSKQYGKEGTELSLDEILFLGNLLHKPYYHSRVLSVSIYRSLNKKEEKIDLEKWLSRSGTFLDWWWLDADNKEAVYLGKDGYEGWKVYGVGTTARSASLKKIYIFIQKDDYTIYQLSDEASLGDLEKLGIENMENIKIFDQILSTFRFLE